MTNKERLISLLGFAPSDKNSLEGALLDSGIAPGDTYTIDSSLEIKKCAIQIMYLLLTTPDTTNESPLGFVKKYDRDAVLKRIAILEEEITPTDSGSVIKGVRPW